MQASLGAKKDKKNDLTAPGKDESTSGHGGHDAEKNEKNEQVVTKGMSTPNNNVDPGAK